MNGMCNSTFFFGPAPGALGRGQISLNFNTKSISNIFIPNFVCVLPNERYKSYRTGLLFCRLDYALGVELGVFGVKN